MPYDIVANVVVVLHSYANVYSLPPPASQHGHLMQHLSSYLHQCGKKLTVFLDHFTPVKGICNYQHLHIIKNSPDHVFTKRTCTNDADNDITLAHNLEEEFDRQILPDNLPDILRPDWPTVRVSWRSTPMWWRESLTHLFMWVNDEYIMSLNT